MVKSEKLEIRVAGMICPQCEDEIADRLIHKRGIINVAASYRKSLVSAEFDSDIINEEQIKAELENMGYAEIKGGSSGLISDMVCIGAIICLLAVLSVIKKWVPVPSVGDNAAFGLIFIAGFCSGVHCIGMCGGIMLTQIAGNIRKQMFISNLLYNGGRIVSYTLIGGICGAIGTLLLYETNIKSMIFTVCGGLVLLMGIQMWGFIPGLRRITMNIGSACSLPEKIRKKSMGKPFIIGFLTGFMPCGMLSAMWAYASGMGSISGGAFVMLIFGSGTLPIMFLFGILGALIPGKYMKYMLKANTVLIVTLGINLMMKGLRLYPAFGLFYFYGI